MVEAVHERVMSTAIDEYRPVEAGLADLRHRLGDIVFDCRTAAGDRQAREARRDLVSLRTSLEDKRKELKAPALERARLIDAEAKRIEAAVRAIEAPIDQQIKVIEQEKEAERQRKLQAEAERIAGVRRQIVETFTRPAVTAAHLSSGALNDVIVAIEACEATAELYGDLHLEAVGAKTEALGLLQAAKARAVEREAQQADLDRQRAELETQRKQDAGDRAEREKAEKAAREAAEQTAAAARAEETKLFNERRAQLDAEEAALKARKEAADREESERARVERERHEQEAMEEGRRREQAAAAEDRFRGAAGQMFDALILWRTVDAANLSRKTGAYIHAAKAREDAIAAASPTKQSTEET